MRNRAIKEFTKVWKLIQNRKRRGNQTRIRMQEALIHVQADHKKNQPEAYINYRNNITIQNELLKFGLLQNVPHFLKNLL